MSKTIKVNNFPRLPLKGSIDLTYRCNNSCLHCWLWVPDQEAIQKQELTFDEIQRIAGEARAMGCRYWYISGGEPLLRPDFPEIFECLTGKATGYTLNTNGTLITPEIARLLTRKGTKMVALYGATAEVYDHVTHHPGGFEKLIQGMNYLKEAGAGFIVQLIPMQANYHQWGEMISLANSFSPHWRLGAPWLYLSCNGSPIRNKEIEAQRLDPYQVVKLDKPTPTYSERMAELNSEIEQVANHKNDDGFNSAPVLESSCRILDEGDDRLFARCIEGRREFHIDAYGKMTWCSYIKDPALRFDLRKGSFGEAWERFIPSCSDKVRGGEEWRENCGSCNKHDDCRWCAAYAYLETGRYGAPIPYLCAVTEEAKRFKEQWKKNHLRYFQVAGITVRLESDINFGNISFKDQLETFAVEGPGKDNITLSHCFELPEFKQGALGQELYHKAIFRFSRKNGTWFYRRYLSEENSKEKLCQLAVFDSDHRHGTVYSSPEIREEIFKAVGSHSPSFQLIRFGFYLY
jgi:MoaA/NifB/PqqE/SkfB family radical SAM enzyme